MSYRGYDDSKDWLKGLAVAVIVGMFLLSFFDKWHWITDMLPEDMIPEAAPAVPGPGGGAPPPGRIVRETPPGDKQAITLAMLNSGQIIAVGPGHVGCDALGDLRDRAAEVDWRVLRFLQEIVAAGFQPRVSCVNTGHARDGKLHPRWQAMDIDAIDGQRVRSLGPRVGDFANWLKSQANEQLPSEIGGPTPLIDPNRRKRNGTGPYFTDGDHQGHWHLGWYNE